MQDFKQRVMEELIECTDSRVQHNDVRQQIISAETRQMKEDTQLFLDIIKRVANEPTQGDTESNSGWVDVSECADTEPTNATPVCVRPLSELMLRVPKLYRVTVEFDKYIGEESIRNKVCICDDIVKARNHVLDVLHIYLDNSNESADVNMNVAEMLCKFRAGFDSPELFVATFVDGECFVALGVEEMFFSQTIRGVWCIDGRCDRIYRNGKLVAEDDGEDYAD